MKAADGFAGSPGRTTLLVQDLASLGLSADSMNRSAGPDFCEVLIGFLEPSDRPQLQAVGALGEIANDSPKWRDYALDSNVLPPLLDLLKRDVKLSTLRVASRTLFLFCKGGPSPRLLDKQTLPAIARLVDHSDGEVITEACWALADLSKGNYASSYVDEIIELGICRRLPELLKHPSPYVVLAALSLASHIAAGSAKQTQAVIDCGALSCLVVLFANPKDSIKEEACFAVSNIMAGTKDQIQSAIDAGLIPPLVELMSNPNINVRREAAIALCNATPASSMAQIAFLVQNGAISAFCDLLAVADEVIVRTALEGLENILKAGQQQASSNSSGGAEVTNPFAQLILDAEDLCTKIEHAQDHPNEDLYLKAHGIAITYLSAESD
ncbi:hypothetical protein VOLCADRAFT_97316 [Volvox carteri f. nagariensis]|uniref:Importin subunit alpha n=1 Tax=Volvox carteri f. nagariensis TaxID=3068 RepID=D8UCF6_VOLCA|nr:uncharacterized protein VOLCADRAFT_97316 [Volvox carteri f. nagariensis]EFJ42484.1 hypothetical protein VOLCADRAFT_97316 [Volvox carteri f. nagariensis]|eukprot:XP_002956340.1 hypothetical protein VOLCADRAFT_97316 [Volvox carteri f. nagariensis]